MDELQQILFYRALESNLNALFEKRAQLDTLIQNVSRTISAIKGEKTMSDKEKFEGFKQKLIDENEQQYGSEIRKKYGDVEVDASNARLKDITEEQYAEARQLAAKVNETLGHAFQSGDPASELAQKTCALHEKWLRIYYPNYSKEYHQGLGEMYVADERFAACYDKIAPGCAVFFRDAIKVYCK